MFTNRYLKKLFLNLIVISSEFALIWTGYNAFTQKWEPALGATIFIANIVVIWVCLSVINRKFRYKKPGLLKTTLTVIGILVICAFAGVQPLSDMKDNMLDKIANLDFGGTQVSDDINEVTDGEDNNLEVEYAYYSSKYYGLSVEYPQHWVVDARADNEDDIRVVFGGVVGDYGYGELFVRYDRATTYEEWFDIFNSPLANTEYETSGRLNGKSYYVFNTVTNGTNTKVYICELEYGSLIIFRSFDIGLLSQEGVEILEEYALHLLDSTSLDTIVLRNPTWQELKAFIKTDDTDQIEYVYPTMICQDFAERLQRNATLAGLKCAIVAINLTGYSDSYGYGIPSDTSHALNAFETTDRGLVYIDCTGLPRGEGSGDADKIVKVEIGEKYKPKYIFNSDGWSWLSMGVVVSIERIDWN